MTESIGAAAGLQMTMQSMPWRDDGLLMGLHWIWWAFWIAVFLALVTAFWRLFSDRSDTRRRVTHEEVAEEALRGRFARGEIDEEEYVRRLRVLRETTLGV